MIFSHWMASVTFLEQSLWKISYVYTFCLQVLLITYLCCINIFSSLKLLMTIFKEERWSWRKVLLENRIKPVSILPVTLFVSLRFRTCNVFNTAFEICRRLIHNWALGYIGCMLAFYYKSTTMPLLLVWHQHSMIIYCGCLVFRAARPLLLNQLRESESQLIVYHLQ